MDLNYFKSMYEQYITLDEPYKTTKLAYLMSEMERVFNIPMQNNEAYNKRNVDVMVLYKQVSNARQL